MATTPRADMVRETSTTTGTGDIVLSGAATGFQSFTTAFGTDLSNIYVGVREDGVGWEILKTGYVNSTNTITRGTATVIDSSNAGSKVNWGAGTRVVYLVAPAEQILHAADNLEDVASATTALTNLGGMPLAGGTFTGDATFNSSSILEMLTAAEGTVKVVQDPGVSGFAFGIYVNVSNPGAATETLEVGSKSAMRLIMDPDGTSGNKFKVSWFDGSAQTAGATISWTDLTSV